MEKQWKYICVYERANVRGGKQRDPCLWQSTDQIKAIERSRREEELRMEHGTWIVMGTMLSRKGECRPHRLPKALAEVVGMSFVAAASPAGLVAAEVPPGLRERPELLHWVMLPPEMPGRCTEGAQLRALAEGDVEGPRPAGGLWRLAERLDCSQPVHNHRDPAFREGMAEGG